MRTKNSFAVHAPPHDKLRARASTKADEALGAGSLPTTPRKAERVDSILPAGRRLKPASSQRQPESRLVAAQDAPRDRFVPVPRVERN